LVAPPVRSIQYRAFDQVPPIAKIDLQSGAGTPASLPDATYVNPPASAPAGADGL
jgi:hypothetical protein